jgi:uncharacterized protein (TIGR00251 family)
MSTTVTLEARDGAVILPVRAQPGARRNGIVGVHDGAVKVAITQVAEKGKANQAIIEVLCEQLALRRAQVELIGGATSRQKRIAIRDIAIDELRRRIAEAISTSH